MNNEPYIHEAGAWLKVSQLWKLLVKASNSNKGVKITPMQVSSLLDNLKRRLEHAVE